MTQIVRLLGIASIFGAVAAAESLAEPLRVVSGIAPGPYYLGQAIEIKVTVEGASGQLVVEPPRPINALIRPLMIDATQPFVARFLIVPERLGALDIPPFRCRSDDQSGTSKPIRLVVANVPNDGRTSAFLGGVGSFQVRAEAEPLVLRPGQTLEYRLMITGSAAWGSVRPPSLSEWKSLTPVFLVENLPDVLEGVDPPTRTFRYQLRPTKAGKVVLPPVSVAAFDPKSGHFATKATASLSIRVEEPPRFDPTLLDYEPIRRTARKRQFGLFALGLGSAALAGLGFWIYSKRNRQLTTTNPARLALELSRRLKARGDEVEPARAVGEALTSFLEQVDGRSPGVLTPPEALEGVERVTGYRNLGELARELIHRCDRDRFGGGSGDAEGLVDEGRKLFEAVADVMGKKKPEGGPREAVETALRVR